MSGERNVIAVSSLAELPEEAARDRETYSKFGVKSVLTIGLAAGGRPPVGALAFSSTQVERAWPEEIVNRLQLVAQIFVARWLGSACKKSGSAPSNSCGRSPRGCKVSGKRNGREWRAKFMTNWARL